MAAEPAEHLAEVLPERGETVAVAESCTGGLVAAELTSISGASDWFAGGVVAYLPRVKEGVLGVEPGVLEEHGAVSEPVARAMAVGVLEAVGADWAVSTTGYAGPEGGPEAPAGTVFVGVARDQGDGPEAVAVERHRIQGARNAARRRMAGDAMADLGGVLEAA